MARHAAMATQSGGVSEPCTPSCACARTHAVCVTCVLCDIFVDACTILRTFGVRNACAERRARGPPACIRPRALVVTELGVAAELLGRACASLPLSTDTNVQPSIFLSSMPLPELAMNMPNTQRPPNCRYGSRPWRRLLRPACNILLSRLLRCPGSSCDTPWRCGPAFRNRSMPSANHVPNSCS